MACWNFIFILIGASTLTAQLFRLIDLIESAPRSHRWEL